MNSTSILTYEGQDISPVTLDAEWPIEIKLIILFLISCSGLLLNILHIVSFFEDASLNRPGCPFMVMMGIVDLLISFIVIPISIVVLMSGQGDNNATCRVQYFIVQTSVYGYLLLGLFGSLEHYFLVRQRKLNKGPIMREWQVFLVITLVILLSITVAALGTWAGLDIDFCKRKHYGNLHFRLTTTVLLIWLPSLLSMFFQIKTFWYIFILSESKCYRHSALQQEDRSYACANMSALIVFLISWIPYSVVAYYYPDISSTNFYHIALIGVVRSVFATFIYMISNRFRRGFKKAFCYIFCRVPFNHFDKPKRYRGRRNRPNFSAHLRRGRPIRTPCFCDMSSDAL